MAIDEKTVDTKASKGRKIRYVTHEKLVNFFPATPEAIPWSHEKRDNLFKSLFLRRKDPREDDDGGDDDV
jgi:protein AATF/BFR2